ncbi:MAG: hypothetical protein CWE10_03795 [Symbiobacterium thermophilum]|nr:hypothetical protein [Symbiobacterium thermophilum]
MNRRDPREPRQSYILLQYRNIIHSNAILAPNIRGSTGFGLDYQKRIHRDWSGDDLKDIESCNRYLRSLDWIDANRIGVLSGSYGRFATLSAAARLPDLWACACDICGPSNLITMLKSVPPFWRPTIKASIGDPDEDREFLIEHSPITYVHQLKVPLMVVQGAMDPRVPRPSPTSWWSGSAPWAGRWSTWSSRTRATASPSVRTC